MRARFLVPGVVLLALVAGTLAFAAKSKPELAQAELSVRNLTCVACARKIEKAVAELPGVAATEVDVAAGRAVVTFVPAEVTAGTIAEAVSAAGYPAGLLRVAPAAAAEPAAAAGPATAKAGCACCNSN